ncbi:MAG TPA: hypothetical protein PKB10_07760, partial [Tepidisphaeraceae bacterium]|nr:hypothetical protein [Tepidisphaeraceae bacterium]
MGIMFERLESRRLLSGTAALVDGVLTVTGTDRAEIYTFERVPGGLRVQGTWRAEEGQFFGMVYIPPLDETFVGRIDRIVVDAGGGNDLVIVGQTRIPRTARRWGRQRHAQRRAVR